MKLPSKLSVATHLHVDALIKGQTEKIEGLVHIAAALVRHPPFPHHAAHAKPDVRVKLARWG